MNNGRAETLYFTRIWTHVVHPCQRSGNILARLLSLDAARCRLIGTVWPLMLFPNVCLNEAPVESDFPLENY
jgi:hypothetical protein